MTLVTGIVIVFLTTMLSVCALGGFALIYESKKSSCVAPENFVLDTIRGLREEIESQEAGE